MESHERDHNRDSSDISEISSISPVCIPESVTEVDNLDGRLSPCQSDVSRLAPSPPPTRPRWTYSVFTALPEVVNFTECADKMVDCYPDENAAFNGHDKIVVEQPSFPEVVIDREIGKEVFHPDLPKPYRQSFLLRPRAWSRRLRFTVAGAVLALVLVLSPGIGLGVDLNFDHLQRPEAYETEIGGTLQPSYFSKEGAFNGTGLAVTYQNSTVSPGNATQGSLILYFQHWTGDVRYMQMDPNGSWTGGSRAEMVTNNATNSSSLSALSYTVDNSSEWHLFFVDKAHRIRESILSNGSSIWHDGPICNLYADVLTSDQAGLQTCWYNVDDPSTVGPDVGLYLWYAPNETSFDQLSWRGGTKVYSYQDGWSNVNGHTSPGCYTQGPGFTTYFMFVDLQGRVNFYWRDTSSNLLATADHPINKWTNTSITITGVAGTASLAYTDVLVAQSESDHMFREYGISWAAENSTLISNSEATMGDQPGVPGSRAASATVPNAQGGKDILVFFQTAGNDITQHRRNVNGGEWSRTTLPIPAD